MTELLRLATGSHKKGSGKGCAMNVISWESGDKTITDLPACADQMLAKLVQRVNDGICTHRDGDLLCPACSVLVLDLAHRTVGTGTFEMSELDRRRSWVAVAADQARQVAHLNTDPRVGAAIEAAEQWVKTPTASYAYAYAAAAAASSASAASASASAAAASSAASAASASASASSASAAYAAAYDASASASDAAASAAYAAYAAVRRLKLAHRAIDRWCEFTGFQPTLPQPEIVACAIERMLALA
jgi:hypothetical protein